MQDHDVPYFKTLLSEETERLKKQCAEWQEVSSDASVSEDDRGEVRTVVGLTELLLNQKFKQFSGLIGDCENKTGEKEVTCEDLQGFWDMVYFEVEKIHKGFSDLMKLKSCNWEKENICATPVKKPSVKTKKPLKVVAKPSSSTKTHILAARKRLAEAKAKALEMNKESAKENGMLVEIQNVKTPKKNKNESPEMSKQSSKKKSQDIIPLACITRSKAAKMGLSFKDCK